MQPRRTSPYEPKEHIKERVMSDKLYICPKCLATYNRKGKCDMCGSKLIPEDIYWARKEDIIPNKEATGESQDQVRWAGEL